MCTLEKNTHPVKYASTAHQHILQSQQQLTSNVLCTDIC